MSDFLCMVVMNKYTTSLQVGLSPKCTHIFLSGMLHMFDKMTACDLLLCITQMQTGNEQ